LDEENALFSGDCILGETSAEFEDLHEYMNSLRRIFDIRPALIYPGHGPLVTNGIERIKEYIEHRTKRNNQILDVLKSSAVPLEPEELVRAIYVGLDENLIPAACFNVSNHLSALLKQSLVGECGFDLGCFFLSNLIVLSLI
jgi:ribonuclease/clavin/mitogillin